MLNRQAFRCFLSEVAGGADMILGKARGVGHGGGVQLRERSRGYADLKWFLTLLDEESAVDRRILDSSLESDGDGITNHAGRDDDNDGVEDIRDAFPSNAAERADTETMDATTIGSSCCRAGVLPSARTPSRSPARQSLRAARTHRSHDQRFR